MSTSIEKNNSAWNTLFSLLLPREKRNRLQSVLFLLKILLSSYVSLILHISISYAVFSYRFSAFPLTSTHSFDISSGHRWPGARAIRSGKRTFSSAWPVYQWCRRSSAFSPGFARWGGHRTAADDATRPFPAATGDRAFLLHVVYDCEGVLCDKILHRFIQVAPKSPFTMQANWIRD